MSTALTNLTVRICLPQGLKLTNGAFLAEDLSVEVISDLSPFYASIPQIRLEGGPYMVKMKDQTIAAQIYQSSKEANLKQDRLPNPASHEGVRFYLARNQWVIYNVVYSLLVSLSGLVGYTGGHVLGNFSTTKQRGEQGTGFSAKLADLKQSMEEYQVVLESAGRVIPGGRPAAVMAAKGVLNNEAAPGRTWMTTGMGSNSTTIEFPNPLGGRGKPMKFFLTPVVSCRYMDSRMFGATNARGALSEYSMFNNGSFGL